MELNIFNDDPARLIGLHKEFVVGQALDNGTHSLIGLDAFIENSKVADDTSEVSMCMFFDNEEVGSKSMMGAGSNIIREITERVFFAVASEQLAVTTQEDYHVAIHKSMVLSCDACHSDNPNYPTKLQNYNKPLIQ